MDVSPRRPCPAAPWLFLNSSKKTENMNVAAISTAVFRINGYRGNGYVISKDNVKNDGKIEFSSLRSLYFCL
jgi:hypothetical protein